MNNKYFLIALALMASTIGFAQVEISGYTGWHTGSITGTYYGELHVKNSQNYGAALALEMRPDMQIELSYMFAPTRAVYERYGRPNINLGDVDVHYYQIGVVRPQEIQSNVDVFGLFTLGATYFDIKNNYVEDSDLGRYQLDDYTSFSVTMGGGVKYWFTDAKKIGLKLQARLLMPITWAGVSVGCSWGGGCGTGVSAGSALFAGDITGGLVIRLGD